MTRSDDTPDTPDAAVSAPVTHPDNPAPGADPAGSGTYLASITENYAQYRATTPIQWGGALAFNPGDPVPADYPTLDQLVTDGMVERVAPPAKSRRR